MTRFRTRPRARRPLDPERLDELALRYVGRYSTTRARLCSYLERKIAERGWSGERDPELAAIAERFERLGYVDDQAYALAKSRELGSRGYGRRRLDDKLRLAGVGDEQGEAARAFADETAAQSAIRFAERRRIGPFASDAADRQQRDKWIAAMVRAGHGFAIARAIASLGPGETPDAETLP